jgi:hypothetical protein
MTEDLRCQAKSFSRESYQRPLPSVTSLMVIGLATFPALSGFRRRCGLGLPGPMRAGHETRPRGVPLDMAIVTISVKTAVPWFPPT